MNWPIYDDGMSLSLRYLSLWNTSCIIAYFLYVVLTYLSHSFSFNLCYIYKYCIFIQSENFCLLIKCFDHFHLMKLLIWLGLWHFVIFLFSPYVLYSFPADNWKPLLFRILLYLFFCHLSTTLFYFLTISLEIILCILNLLWPTVNLYYINSCYIIM